MKRNIVIFLFILILFSGCSNVKSEQVSMIKNKYKPCITINALTVYKTEDNYFISIDYHDNYKTVEFTFDRKCNQSNGLKLIKDEELEHFLNLNFNEIIKKFGQPHVDVGSGFYLPAYITEDADLICFELENDIVVDVIKRDLFTNEITERAVS